MQKREKIKTDNPKMPGEDTENIAKSITLLNAVVVSTIPGRFIAHDATSGMTIIVFHI